MGLRLMKSGLPLAPACRARLPSMGRIVILASVKYSERPASVALFAELMSHRSRKKAIIAVTKSA